MDSTCLDHLAGAHAAPRGGILGTSEKGILLSSLRGAPGLYWCDLSVSRHAPASSGCGTGGLKACFTGQWPTLTGWDWWELRAVVRLLSSLMTQIHGVSSGSTAGHVL